MPQSDRNWMLKPRYFVIGHKYFKKNYSIKPRKKWQSAFAQPCISIYSTAFILSCALEQQEIIEVLCLC